MKNASINSTEIAKRAGVSRSTVSRVINNYSNVPEETREKVMQVIRQYNYVPNASAQALAGKTTRTVGLFLIEKGEVGDALTNSLLVSVINSASAAGYFVLTSILRHMDDAGTLQRVKDMFNQRRMNGAIFIGARSEEPLIEQLIGEGFLVAAVDQSCPPERSEPNRITASFDNASGMRQAVDYLASLGHREIALINGDLGRLSGITKAAGFLAAMESCGLAVRDEWMLAGSFHESGGYGAVQSLLRGGGPLPTAVVAANDSVAFGAMKAFHEHGFAIPRDVSIVGFDDHPLSAMAHPALTTAKMDFTGMMRSLTEALIGRIEERPQTERQFEVGFTLIVRDSCRAI